MLSFSLHININNGPIAACNALSQPPAMWPVIVLCEVNPSDAGDNDDGVRTNDDQNDKDDNIDCDQLRPAQPLYTRVRRRHGVSISWYDWLSARYPGWLMTGLCCPRTTAAITDHDNKNTPTSIPGPPSICRNNACMDHSLLKSLEKTWKQ